MTRSLLLGIALGIAAPGAIVAQFNVPRGRLTQTAFISGVDEDFSRIGIVFVAPDGRIGVTQPQDGKAIIYSAAGKKLASMGGLGDGPGEFRNLSAAGFLGDTIWATDSRARRISTFTSSGQGIATTSFALLTTSSQLSGIPAGFSYSIFARLGDGSLVASLIASATTSPPALFVRINPEKQIERVLLRHDPYVEILTLTGTGGRTFYGTVPFANGADDFVAPDGNRIGNLETRFGTRNELRLLVVSARGDTLVTKVYPFTGTPITKAEKDSAVAERLKARTGPAVLIGADGSRQNVTPNVPQADLDAYESAMRARMPVLHAPTITARFGVDNSIWIQVRPTGAAAEWVMLSERGTPELSLVLPPKTRIGQISRTTLWAIQLDADDIPSVVRYRIEK